MGWITPWILLAWGGAIFSDSCLPQQPQWPPENTAFGGGAEDPRNSLGGIRSLPLGGGEGLTKNHPSFLHPEKCGIQTTAFRACKLRGCSSQHRAPHKVADSQPWWMAFFFPPFNSQRIQTLAETASVITAMKGEAAPANRLPTKQLLKAQKTWWPCQQRLQNCTLERTGLCLIQVGNSDEMHSVPSRILLKHVLR